MYEGGQRVSRYDGRRGNLSAALRVLAEGDAGAVVSDRGDFDGHGVVRHHDVSVDSFHAGCPRERLWLSSRWQKERRFFLVHTAVVEVAWTCV